MKYKMHIQGIHCKGCETLIKMTMEENNFKNIKIDTTLNEIYITYEDDKKNLEISLNKTFSELKNYSYSNLKQIGDY